MYRKVSAFLANISPMFWILLVTVILSLNLLGFVNGYAINLLYHDQWDLYNPMFSNGGIGEAFLYQHGPHRQGLGGVLTYLLARATGFSTVAESYMIASVLILSSFAVLRLKQKLGYELTIKDVAIPLIVLNPVQMETITTVPNLSHSVLPLLLLVLLSLAWISESNWCKYTASSFVAGVALFTGFGIFVWLSFFVLLILKGIREFLKRDYSAARFCFLGVGIMLGFAIWFATNYRSGETSTAVSNLQSSLENYFAFTSYLFGRAFYFPKSIRFYTGIVTLVFVLYFAWTNLKLIYRNAEKSKLPEVCLLLFATTFLYIAATAFGRADLGPEGGGSSRYTSLTLPCFLAIHLIISSGHRINAKRWLHAQNAFVALAFLSYLSNVFYAHDTSESKYRGKRNWLIAYDEKADLEQAEFQSGFAIYPDNAAIEQKVAYLREHRLNLFKHIPKK